MGIKNRDYSKMSKVISNYILSKDREGKEFDILTPSQKEVLNTKLPRDLIDNDNLYREQNSMFVKTKPEVKTYKVNYNEVSKWFAPSGWQKQITTILSLLDYPFDNSKSSLDNFRQYFVDRGNNGLCNYLDLLFSSITSIDEYVIIDKEIKNIGSYESDYFDFEYLNVTSDIVSAHDKKTWLIYVDGIELIQVQAATTGRDNNHIARLNLENIQKFYDKVIESTETWGISVEVALCQFNSIPVPKEYYGRYKKNMVLDAQNVIANNMETLNIPPFNKISATIRSGHKKSATDFVAGDKTVSVKTNYNSNYKVCPPEIGQPGIKEGLTFYNSLFDIQISEEELEKDKFVFKQQFQKHIKTIVEKQIEYLFSEDYILYMRKTDSKGIEIDFLNTQNKKYNLEGQFTFTQSPENWNESVSISYNGISLAEMQLHNNRSPFKFRFNFKNLLSVLKDK